MTSWQFFYNKLYCASEILNLMHRDECFTADIDSRAILRIAAYADIYHKRERKTSLILRLNVSFVCLSLETKFSCNKRF